MSHTFDSMLKEATALPWTMGARLMVELRSTVRIPEEPRLTKSAAAGLVKIARICKMAQTPEEAQQAVQQQAMVDPNVVQALDYQQAESERQAMMAKIQELQMATEAAQAQAQMADQQAQAATQQQEQLMMQAQQAKQEQVNAVMESMQAKDQTLQTQVSAQQHRQQVAQFAQQMADQLKQIASTSPEEQQIQQAEAEQAQQQQAMQQQQQGQEEQPVKKKTKQQQQEAQNAQEHAQKQTAQAEQATAEDQQEMQGMQAQQQQAAAMGGQPKMGSAKLQKIAARFKFARLRKQAEDQPPEYEKRQSPEDEYENQEGDHSGLLDHIVHLRSRLVNQGMSPADIDHYIRLIEEGEDKAAEEFAEESIGEEHKHDLPGKVAMLHLHKIASLVKSAQFSGTNEGYGESQGGSGQQGMFSYSSMGKCGGCGKMAKLSSMGKCGECSMGKEAARRPHPKDRDGVNKIAGEESEEDKKNYQKIRAARHRGAVIGGALGLGAPTAALVRSPAGAIVGTGLGALAGHAYESDWGQKSPVGRYLLPAIIPPGAPLMGLLGAAAGARISGGKEPDSEEYRRTSWVPSRDLAKSGQDFTSSSSGLGADQGGIGAQGGMNQYASMGKTQDRKKPSPRRVVRGIDKSASPHADAVHHGYAVGKYIRHLKALKDFEPHLVEVAEGMKRNIGNTYKDLPLARAAMHLGEHAPKYQAGAAAAGIVGAGAVGYHQGKKKTASEEARTVGAELGVDWSKVNFTPADLAKGMKIEEEHGPKDPHETAKVALDHLRERGDYYDLLAKKVEEAPKMEGGESAAKEKQEHQEKQGSFDPRRAAAIAQRVRLIKEGQLKKVHRDSADVAESRQLQLVKSAAAPAAVESGARRLGSTAGYAAVGAAIGAGLEKARLRAHEKKFGMDKPTEKEIKLIGKLQSAKKLVKDDPSYVNKLRVSNIKYNIDMERLGREHPNRASVRGATRGALAGLTIGPFAREMVRKVIKR